jgi:hypothetical protein
MTTTTILIKRNADRNYDKLFARIEAATLFGRVSTLSERETPEGYAVEFASLDQDVLAWVESKSKDFAIVW